MGIGIAEDGMAVVTVKKSELLAKLKWNRNTHTAVYEAALKGYRLALVAMLEKKLADAKEGKAVPHRLDLVEPTSNVKDYDRVISMLEMSVKDEMQITEDQFDKYVMDAWGWKASFEAGTSRYLGG